MFNKISNPYQPSVKYKMYTVNVTQNIKNQSTNNKSLDSKILFKTDFI